jgi:hypothetical protein
VCQEGQRWGGFCYQRFLGAGKVDA